MLKANLQYLIQRERVAGIDVGDELLVGLLVAPVLRTVHTNKGDKGEEIAHRHGRDTLELSMGSVHLVHPGDEVGLRVGRAVREQKLNGARDELVRDRGADEGVLGENSIPNVRSTVASGARNVDKNLEKGAESLRFVPKEHNQCCSTSSEPLVYAESHETRRGQKGQEAGRMGGAVPPAGSDVEPASQCRWYRADGRESGSVPRTFVPGGSQKARGGSPRTRSFCERCAHAFVPEACATARAVASRWSGAGGSPRRRGPVARGGVRVPAEKRGAVTGSSSSNGANPLGVCAGAGKRTTALSSWQGVCT